MVNRHGRNNNNKKLYFANIGCGEGHGGCEMRVIRGDVEPPFVGNRNELTSSPSVDLRHMVEPYASTAQFDLYAAAPPEDASKPLIVYVHGGAWRSESKALFAPLAHRIREHVGFPVAIVEYRLSVRSQPDYDSYMHSPTTLHSFQRPIISSIPSMPPTFWRRCSRSC